MDETFMAYWFLREYLIYTQRYEENVEKEPEKWGFYEKMYILKYLARDFGLNELKYTFEKTNGNEIKIYRHRPFLDIGHTKEDLLALFFPDVPYPEHFHYTCPLVCISAFEINLITLFESYNKFN